MRKNQKGKPMLNSELKIDDKINVFVNETGEPIRTGNPCTITAIKTEPFTIHATESNGKTKRLFAEKHFRFELVQT
jgi:hypothetical protein